MRAGVRGEKSDRESQWGQAKDTKNASTRDCRRGGGQNGGEEYQWSAVEPDQGCRPLFSLRQVAPDPGLPLDPQPEGKEDRMGITSPSFPLVVVVVQAQLPPHLRRPSPGTTAAAASSDCYSHRSATSTRLCRHIAPPQQSMTLPPSSSFLLLSNHPRHSIGVSACHSPPPADAGLATEGGGTRLR